MSTASTVTSGLRERLNSMKESGERALSSAKEYVKGSWGNPYVLVIGVVVASLLASVLIVYLHGDIFADGAVFDQSKIGIFASGSGLIFVLFLFLAMAGGAIALALSLGQNLWGIGAAVVGVFLPAFLAWYAIRDVKQTPDDNTDSWFGAYAFLLVIILAAMPIAGFWMMHTQMNDKKMVDADEKTKEHMGVHYMWVKIGAVASAVGVVGTIAATYRMWTAITTSSS